LRVQNQEPQVTGLYVGRAQELWPGKPPSAIKKSAVKAADLSVSGLDGDEQADLRLHGGVEKALHHYPAQHYAIWERELLSTNGVVRPGGFGENLSSYHLHERNVCVADIFKIGQAVVQVSQGRTPCWKLNRHTGVKTMAADFLRTGRTGWYCRVIEEGRIRVSDEIELIDRINPDWTVMRVTHARVSDGLDVMLAAEIAQLPGLSTNWKNSFKKKTHKDYHEDPAQAWQDEWK